MAKALIEHMNLTVSDPARTAQMLVDLFDWEIRWKGRSQFGGSTIHVGTGTQYLAVFAPDTGVGAYSKAGANRPGLNHIGVEVDSLDETEARVLECGYETFNHGDYEPGRRFYFLDDDGIEYEVVSYADGDTPPV